MYTRYGDVELYGVNLVVNQDGITEVYEPPTLLKTLWAFLDTGMGTHILSSSWIIPSMILILFLAVLGITISEISSNREDTIKDAVFYILYVMAIPISLFVLLINVPYQHVQNESVELVQGDASTMIVHAAKEKGYNTDCGLISNQDSYLCGGDSMKAIMSGGETGMSIYEVTLDSVLISDPDGNAREGDGYIISVFPSEVEEIKFTADR